ncbi:MAG: cytochrome c biogenesis heme-transporting ATPase CcmA [Nitrospirae bacterium]|nr:cytochrome c biogenesis heme-transporting ATPase CcmA [Nitrospirota bacterium]
MLEAVDLECVRGDRRLFAGVGLTVAPGELLHVRGPNGSGKTTLLRMLCGLVKPVAGEVRWAGRPARELGDGFLALLTYVGHHNAIKDELTGPENLLVHARLCGAPDDAATLSAALERLGMKAYGRVPCKVLSAGQKRRTALARLLISRSPLWILDEPFNALDVGAVATLQQAIQGHLQRDGMVVLTTHQDVPIDGAVKTLHMGA